MSVFFGRAEELSYLEACWSRALGNNSRTVFIAGDAGAGKSTLLDAFLAQVAQTPANVTIVRAACSEHYGAEEPYQPFADAFRSMHAQEPANGRNFLQLARRIAPHWVAAIPVAGEVLAATLSTAAEVRNSIRNDSRAPTEEALFFQYAELVFQTAAANPVVLFLDDLHWADRGTLALLGYIARRATGHSILIVGAYRPSDVDAQQHPLRGLIQELQRYDLADELALGPLDDAALAALVAARTGSRPDPRLFSWLTERAGSNALFFDGLLDLLVQKGYARSQGGYLVLERVPHDGELPANAESTIQKRLLRLDEESLRLLEGAALCGSEFDSYCLSMLVAEDELRIEERLDPLVRVHHIISRRGLRELPGGECGSLYAFTHPLIQAALQAGIHGKRRILLHRRMVAILDQLYGAEAEVVAGRMALHAEEGQMPARAYACAFRAATRAIRLYAPWEALAQAERALRNAPDSFTESLAYQRLGEQLHAVGRYTEAATAFNEALSRTSPDRDALRCIALRHALLISERDQGTRPAPELLRDLAALREEARSAGDRAEECRILLHMLDLPGSTETTDLAVAEEGLALARETGDDMLLARAHHIMGMTSAFRGGTERAIVELDQAAAAYRGLGDRAREASCLNNIAVAHVFKGEFAAAVELFTATMRTFDELADLPRACAARSNLGYLLRVLGEWDQARRLLGEALSLAERLESPVRALPPLQNLAELDEALHNDTDAERHWRQLLEWASSTGYESEETIAVCGIGNVRLRRGDHVGAAAALDKARSLATHAMGETNEGRQAVRLLEARLRAAQGDLRAAVEALDWLDTAVQATDIYQAAVYKLERARVLRRHAPAQARAAAEQARATFARLGARPQEQLATRLLSEMPVHPREVIP